MTARVAITGLGAVTCLSRDLAGTWAALVSGRSGLARVPSLVAAGTRITIGGEIIAARGVRTDEAEVEAAVAAAAEACAEAGVATTAARLSWACGLDSLVGPGGYHRVPSGEVFARIATRFGPRPRRFATTCAAGAQAIAEAARAIGAGVRGPWIAGGSSAMLTPFYVHGLSQLAVLARDRDDAAVCRPFDQQRAGTALGDGAAAMVLEPLEEARRRGARVLAELVGVGTSQDAHDLFKPPPDGHGAELALRRALDDARIAVGAVDAVVAHATGTTGGDAAEAAALRRVLGAHAEHVAVTAPKGALGHAMMAAGAIGAVVAAAIVTRRAVPPTAHLDAPDPECRLDHVIAAARRVDARVAIANAFGMGGHNVVLAIASVEDR